MRLAIALLIVINALLLAVQQGIIPLPTPARPEPVPQPLRAEQVQLAHRTVTTAANNRPAPPQTATPELASPPEAAQSPSPASTEGTVPPPPVAHESPPEAVATRATTEPPATLPPALPPAPVPAVSPSTVADPSPLTAPPSSLPLSPPPPPAAAPPTAKGRCIATQIAPEGEAILRELARTLPGLKLTEKPLPATVEAWWVATPSQRSEAAARAYVETLKQKGVSETFIIRDPGPNQWRISLGLFRIRERAELLRSQLQAKGVSPIEIVPRQKAGRIQVIVTGPEETVGRYLAHSKARLPALTWENCTE